MNTPYNAINKIVENRFWMFLESEGLEAGPTPVTVDRLLKVFKGQNPDLYVTKALLGRLCTKQFPKKQMKSGDKHVQCYFLNKNI